MKKSIRENFEIRKGSLTTQKGGKTTIAYITSTNGEQSFDFKDVIKKYNGRWFPNIKSWGWFVNDNNKSELIDSQIKPCLRELNNLIAAKDNDIIQILDKIISVLSNSSDNLDDVKIDTKKIEANVREYKEKFLNAVSDEEFKKLMEPIIKFKRAQGHKFSLLNAILILVQFPNASMVKSVSRWKAVNREILPNQKPIALYVPQGYNKLYNKEEKDLIIKDYLSKRKVKSLAELTPGEREKLDVELNRVDRVNSFKLIPNFYDYSQTKQIEGTEDMIGNPNHDIKWFDDSGEETEETIAYVDAIEKVIQNSNIELGFVDDLGGARGVSKNGKIEVLKNSKKDLDLFKTLIHEFAHELLHQTYSKNNNEQLRDYYIGTEKGRHVVEQQAEVVAWIVLMHFGYNSETSINYVGLWGIDEKTAVSVFDSVARAATKIVELIVEELDNNSLQESLKRDMLKLSGESLANMLGFGELYQKGKEKSIEEINENFYKILNKIN
jgi:hypothetical protein